MIKSIKEWTILIYADGNNELVPEMIQSKLDVEKFGPKHNLNVVMQIGLASMELVKILTPLKPLPKHTEISSGVKRYYVLNSKSILIEDLGNINMAGPHNLYDFIKWGIENYPAKHYLLALSGHGFSFVGAIPDLSQNTPYLMNLVDMCKAVNMSQKDTGVKIDILLLDMCHMNKIEVIYELGKDKENSVKNVITYIENGPLRGIPYDKILSSLEKSIPVNDIGYLIKDILNNINLNLVAIDINYESLEQIKRTVNNLAYFYLINERFNNKPPSELIYSINCKDPFYNYVLELQNALKQIIIYYKSDYFIKNNIINITTTDLSKSFDSVEVIPIYNKLGFAKNNLWSNVITNKAINDPLKPNIDILFKPMFMSSKILIPWIWSMNSYLSKDEILLVSYKLLKYMNRLS
ncbi:clostripain-related cysteine peptidase [Oceanirhabdus seepicola]|uniref:Clostripain n=1 Tax=Oceanirhabdus seepicola TaxID=2828781 RepID=A0A9J6P3R2_9CLOT|nr:clostripain-related cysteine peptidase [Oceanirhabdus seepicola]MCM1990445.1 clostripain [Oceanirhabdus seepicola]